MYYRLRIDQLESLSKPLSKGGQLAKLAQMSNPKIRLMKLINKLKSLIELTKMDLKIGPMNNELVLIPFL